MGKKRADGRVTEVEYMCINAQLNALFDLCIVYASLALESMDV